MSMLNVVVLPVRQVSDEELIAKENLLKFLEVTATINALGKTIGHNMLATELLSSLMFLTGDMGGYPERRAALERMCE